MLILPDNDVEGAVVALRYILESSEWREYSEMVGATFTDFEELGLPRDAPDRVIWETCQSVDAVLITANRTGNGDSLDTAIRELSGPSSLPVVTIADAQRLLRDRVYAEEAANRLLNLLEHMDSLRGTGRLFIP